jgi:proline iminopeptidase
MSGKHTALGTIVLAAACSMGIAACAPDERNDVEPEGFLTGAEGARLHYQVVGDGSDTVVVVHGGPGAGSNSVRPDFEPLAERLTLVFYDQRGGGLSELPADTTRLRARYFVEDLDSVRAHFGLDRMNVLAHSFGSVIVARYAQEHSDRIGRIVLHGATGPVRERAAQLARRVTPNPDTVLSRKAGELLGSLLDGSSSDPAATCREWEGLNRRMAEARGDTIRWRGSSCDAPSEAVGYYFRYTAQLSPRTFGDWNFTEGLEKVSTPVLVVYSADDDSLAVAEQRAWSSAFPAGRLLLVPGADKGALGERPDIVVPAVIEFFTRPDASITCPREPGVECSPPLRSGPNS